MRELSLSHWCLCNYSSAAVCPETYGDNFSSSDYFIVLLWGLPTTDSELHDIGAI